MKKRTVAKVMAVLMFTSGVFSGVGGGTAYAAEPNTPPGKPTDIKVEMLEYAYGINTKNPAFSWVVHDEDKNEIQTAYRIVVSSTSALEGDVLDTDWVESSESSYVHADALEGLLEDNELYYWQVQTKDKDGAESPLSDARPFMTDIASQWQSLNGIWATPNAVTEPEEPQEPAEDEWTDYTVEQTMSINGDGKEGYALALLIRMSADGQNGYMVQARNQDNVIKIHQISAGTIDKTAFAEINLGEKGITLPEDNTEFKLKVTAAGSKLSFAVDTAMQGDSGYVEAGEVDITGSGNYTSGKIGYRTGLWESGTIDNLKVSAADGGILYESAFDADDGRFPGCTVADGKLSVGKGVQSVYTEAEEVFRWGDYTIEQTMTVTAGDALAMLLHINAEEKSGYMAQIRTQDNVIKLHKVTGGNIDTNAFQEINLSDSGITLPTDGSPFRIKTVLDGSAISFAIDTTAKDGSEYVEVEETADISGQGNLTEGQFGYRTGRTEAGTIDDIKITSKEGSVVYENDFAEDDGKFSGNGLSVKEGVLEVEKSAFSVFDPDKEAGEEEKLPELSRFSFIRSPRLTIENKENVDKAIVSIATRGTAKDRGTIADLFMNGTCLGAGSARELGKVGSYGGTSNYTQVFYNSYDVTELLGDGDENVISVIGNCRDEKHGVLVQMTVFYKDGTKEIVTNSSVEDSGWKTLDGTQAFGDKGDGIGTGYVTLLHENINANAYPFGWNEVDFDDSEWAPAQVNSPVADAASGTSGRVLYPFSSENALRIETKEETKKIYTNEQGNVVVDLGKEIIGGIKVDIESASKQKVTVHMGEEMNDDGTVKWQLSAVPDYEDIWTLREGENAFETVTMRNVRYIEFIGLDDETKKSMTDNPDSVTGWAIQQPFDENDSSYEATDGTDAATLMNRLYELSKYTIQATNQDVFVDSQARERAPYEGDLLVNSNTSYSVSDNYSLARHSNEWLMDNETWPNDYRIFSVEMTYWDYLYTGNIDSLRENYNALKRKLTAEVEYEDAATGLIRANGSQAGNSAIIDWPTSERDGYQSSYYDVVFNSEYVGIYLDMAVLSEALGETADAQYYTQKSEKLKESLLKYAYDEQNGCFYDSLDQNYNATKHSSTHATAYALCYGVFDSQSMADDMCEFVYNQCKEEFKGSVYVTYFILKGLYNGNHGEYAEKLMTNPKVGENVKTFASLLDDLHCTITPEAWGHKWKGNMTMSHPWGAAPGCSIVQGTFGILPTKAGFEEFDIKIQPGDIASAKVKAPTVKGAVEVSYSGADKENALVADVTIPANTKAKVYMPVTNKNLGYLLIDKEKTEAVNNGSHLFVELGSGSYHIEISDEETEYKPHLTVKANAEKTELYTEETTAISAGVTDQFGDKITKEDGLTLTYESADENILTVDKDGAVTAVSEGAAAVTVTAEYMGEKASASVDFHVSPAPVVMTDMVLEIESKDAAIGVGKTTKAVLKAVYSDGHEEAIDPSLVTFQADSDAVKIEADGTITGLKEGEAVITASTLQKTDELNEKFASDKIVVDTVWAFDGKTSPLQGVEVKDGKLYAKKGQKVINTDADKQGSVISGSFTIESTAASISFNTQDNSHRYFWQFRTDGTLKKHKGDAEHFDTVSIQLKDGENKFLIATIDGKIYTYLNQQLVDVCDVDPNMPVSGGFGVRNGNSESFYINSLNIGNEFSLKAQNQVSVTDTLPVIESVTNPENILVANGTAWEDLHLPQTVEAVLSDGTTVPASVEWSGNYDGNTAGEYVLTGTINGSSTYENPEAVSAQITVTVQQAVLNPVILTDEKTGITVEAEAGILPEDAVLKVTQIQKGDAYDAYTKALKDTCSSIIPYEVKVLKDGQEIDLAGNRVTVKIPVPEGYDTDRLLLYQAAEDGTLDKVAFRCEDGKIILESDRLGVFVVGEKIQITEEEQTQNSDKDKDSQPADAVKTGDDTKGFYLPVIGIVGALLLAGGVTVITIRRKRDGKDK
ncbi:MAG: family 78 glycoside hydrolase catalytic domain [Clostridiales bacterium]|nr:family 78 glycoside hydrolase catalytic domain [Clostridiales bacterium]